MGDDRWLITRFFSWLTSGFTTNDPEEALRAERLNAAVSGYCNPNKPFRNSQGMTPLMHVCKYGTTDQFIAFFRTHQNTLHLRSMNSCNENGETPLLISIRRGSLYFVRILVNRGTDINQSNPYSKVSPIMLSCLLSELGIFNYLLNQGAVLHERDKENKGLLEYAARAANQNFLVNLLIKYQKIYQHEPNKLYQNLIFEVIKARHLDALYTMINIPEGWPRDLVGPHGYSLLMQAVASQDEQAVAFLLEDEQDINYKNPEGESALSLSIQGQSLKICDSILKKHPVLTSIDQKSGNTMLMQSLLHNKPLVVAAILREISDFPYYAHQNQSGQTACHLAVGVADKICIDYCLDHHPTLFSIADYENQYPWMCAWKRHHQELLQYLFEKAPQHHLFLKDPMGDTPLLTAIRYRDLNLLKMLVELGAHWNDKTASDETALILALKVQAFDIVHFILKFAEIDWNARDCDSISAMDLATEQGSFVTVAFLIAKNCTPSPKGKQVIMKLVEGLLFSNVVVVETQKGIEAAPCLPT